jgi:hypothetical protein
MALAGAVSVSNRIDRSALVALFLIAAQIGAAIALIH